MSDVPDEMRGEMLEYYIQSRVEQEGSAFNAATFRAKYYGYVLARMMQAMGAYGYRGVIEKKEYFVKSIPFAVNNLRKILSTVKLPVEVPHLISVLRAITELPEYNKDSEGLTVTIFSFSYRKSIPFDKSGNGGGYVFDCRALPNPGLFDEYKQLNGRDQEVIEFFDQHPETEQYLSHLFAIVDQSVETYISREYTRLMLCFGCTGGRHRSVYCAEQTVRHLRENYDCNVILHHLEQGKF